MNKKKDWDWFAWLGQSQIWRGEPVGWRVRWLGWGVEQSDGLRSSLHRAGDRCWKTLQNRAQGKYSRLREEMILAAVNFHILSKLQRKLTFLLPPPHMFQKKEGS